MLTRLLYCQSMLGNKIYKDLTKAFGTQLDDTNIRAIIKIFNEFLNDNGKAITAIIEKDKKGEEIIISNGTNDKERGSNNTHTMFALDITPIVGIPTMGETNIVDDIINYKSVLNQYKSEQKIDKLRKEILTLEARLDEQRRIKTEANNDN